MGDGQHIWAAAEWILMVRNCFVREENEKLIFASGIPDSWLVEGREAALGPTLTAFGSCRINIKTKDGKTKIQWQSQWHPGKKPVIEIHLYGLVVPAIAGVQVMEISDPRGQSSRMTRGLA